MKQYKVVALSVGAKSNKIFKSGDIVTEDAFHEGHAAQLVEQGFLTPHEVPKKEPKGAKGAVNQAENDAPVKPKDATSKK